MPSQPDQLLPPSPSPISTSTTRGPKGLSSAVRTHRAKAKSKRKQRQKAHDCAAGIVLPKPPKIRSSLSRRVGKTVVVPTNFDTARFRRANWAFVGVHTCPFRMKSWTVPELLRIGFRVLEWDGSLPHVLCDPRGRIVSVLPGRPQGPEWDVVTEEATVAFEEGEKESRRWSTTDLVDGRRGDFLALDTGISYGGGPQVAGNLRNSGPMQRIIDKLLATPALQRIAGFGSSIFALYAPKVYSYYQTTLDILLAKFPHLKRPFPNSVFPAATVNLGPATVTNDHLDCTNVPHGWCTITPLGRFDHTKGGQLILWEFGLIINIPSGSTVAIPSASIRHANTPIAPGEVRFSLSQYSLVPSLILLPLLSNDEG
ncbi:hypothetical protein EWM64_g3386 [Hericium alpestre]|uniref:Uncharacterized protein n=1 Tax=Hericium alpestre TaxID=135208 RepID=A0A4Z0A0G5_9AGAM|nr:hypothetical protein EWM64_g3386 [Hericium alpestre]